MSLGTAVDEATSQNQRFAGPQLACVRAIGGSGDRSDIVSGSVGLFSCANDAFRNGQFPFCHYVWKTLKSKGNAPCGESQGDLVQASEAGHKLRSSLRGAVPKVGPKILQIKISRLSTHM